MLHDYKLYNIISRFLLAMCDDSPFGMTPKEQTAEESYTTSNGYSMKLDIQHRQALRTVPDSHSTRQ